VNEQAYDNEVNRLRRERLQREQAAAETAAREQRCSACGSTAPHHVDYVRQHGVCVS
jgi:hypothetical protein